MNQPPDLGDLVADPQLADTLLQALLQQAPDAILLKDRSSRIIAVSHSAAHAHGVAPEGLLGQRDQDLFSEDTAQWSLVDDESVLATGQALIGKRQKIARRDGREAWMRITKLPLYDATGTCLGTAAVAEGIDEQQRLTSELERTRRDLLGASRAAGMAEVATSVLHHVGNAVTSVNVSAEILATGLRDAKNTALLRLAAMVQQNAGRTGEFLSRDPRGRRVPEFLESLAQHLDAERDRLLHEVVTLQGHLDHIKDIITVQQAYATTAGVVEALDLAVLAEDTLRMNAEDVARHAITIVRDFHPVRPVRGEKAKVLQILVHLIRNATHACAESDSADKTVTLRVFESTDHIVVSVSDNGIGIDPAQLHRLFEAGFTTRADGHGFGLYSARRAAADLGGTLQAESGGRGHGATFTLALPHVS